MDEPVDIQLPPEYRALIEQANAAEREGQFASVRTAFEKALALLAERGPAKGAAANAADIIRRIGSTYRDEGDHEAALDCYEASLAIAELAGDRAKMAAAVNTMATVYYMWGQLDAAEEFYVRSHALAQEGGDRSLVAAIEQNLGIIANIRGDLARALHHYQEGLSIYRELGDDKYVAPILNNLAMVHTDLRQWSEAEKIFEEAAEVAGRIGDTRTLVMVHTNQTELYLLEGKYDRARECCDAGFELASRIEYHLGLGEVYKNYGVIFRETGKYSLAETHLKTAAEIAERYSNPLLAGEVQRELAEVYRIQDRNSEALQALNYAHRVFTELRARLDLQDIDRRLGELEQIFLEVVRRWGESIESKDHYTAGHCQRVADYSCMLAEAVGFDQQTLTWFRMGAFLHDVGKTTVPPEILNKEGRLTEEEWAIMREHTLRGVELLSSIEFPWDVRPMVRNHHERWDGTGYPDGLSGRAIPLSARILCVADVFDALTTTRSYRQAFNVQEALAIMEADAGRIFDPELFGTFKQLILESLKERAVPAGN